MLENIILVAAILLILGGAAFYIVKAKKRGDACIGCPYAKECAGKSNGCSCCGGNDKK